MPARSFTNIVRDIKELRIQGAEGVAREGVSSLYLVLKDAKAVTKEGLVAELYRARDVLVAARPTEPCLRNALHFVLHNVHEYDDEHNLVSHIKEQIDAVLRHFDQARERIVTLGAAKIRHHSVVYTHCHSSTVVAILKEAHKQKKKFIVYNTETRPLWQGRKTATELAAAGIKVHHFVDSAARLAIKDAHIALFGCDAITQDYIYNKIGSGMFAELLASRQIPLYICTNAWKFDPLVVKGHHEKIEEREIVEVWEHPPRGVHITNPAFEEIPMNDVSGIISELGTSSPQVFLKNLKKTYSWMK